LFDGGRRCPPRRGLHDGGNKEEKTMQECAVKEIKTLTWTEPAYCDVRLGFEVTAYIYVR